METKENKPKVFFLERGEFVEEFRVFKDEVLVIRRVGKHRTYTRLPLWVARRHYKDLLKIGYQPW
jgi:hypothetical protein